MAVRSSGPSGKKKQGVTLSAGALGYLVSGLNETAYDDQDEESKEWARCRDDEAYFISNYCRLKDEGLKQWVPFLLWPFQVEVIEALADHRLVIILKARQLGLTWLMLAHALWLMLFHPAATVLLFSRREEEAKTLLGEERLFGMFERLPEWLSGGKGATASRSTVNWRLRNGSVARAFPSNVGDSYSASFVLADEFDLVEDQEKLLNAVKPTIEKGQLVLLSKVDKAHPQSAFKRIFEAARRSLNKWHPIFLPWFVRPDRTPEFYNDERADSLARTGSLDFLYENYPETAEQALMLRLTDRRLPEPLLRRAYVEEDGYSHSTVPGLTIYKEAIPGRQYRIGADTAEGNPGSDDSVGCIIDARTEEQVAVVSGKHEPPVFGLYLQLVSHMYNMAGVLVERNNHGGSVIMWMEEHAPEVDLLLGEDGKIGHNTLRGPKALAYVHAAERLASEAPPTIHSRETYLQLASINGDTLKAPDREPDDHAVAWVLALLACSSQGAAVDPGAESGSVEDSQQYRYAVTF